MHFKQRLILKLLEEENGRRYSELYRYFEYEDKFPYHLKQLLKYKFVNKRDGLYFITKKGIREKENYDSRSLADVNSKIPRFLYICKYKNKYFLMECPGKFYILPGGAPIKGESIQDAGKRILKEKFDLEGVILYRCTHHYINYTTDRDILFDNICLVFDVDIRKGYKAEHTWFSLSEIKRLKKIHPTVKKFIVVDSREKFSSLEFVHDYGFKKEDI